jgi:hypothetical protein
VSGDELQADAEGQAELRRDGVHGQPTGSLSPQVQAGRSPVLDAAQLEVPRRYGTERDMGAGEVLFADGDLTYDLFVVLAVPGNQPTRGLRRRRCPQRVNLAGNCPRAA